MIRILPPGTNSSCIKWTVLGKLIEIFYKSLHYTLLIEKVITLLYWLLSSKSNVLHYLLLYFCYSAVSSVKVAFKQLKILHTHMFHLLSFTHVEIENKETGVLQAGSRRVWRGLPAIQHLA